MSTYRESAWLLLERRRFPEAETELRQALAENPNDADAHAWLALALSAQNRHSEAKQAARQAVRITPDNAYYHYVLCRAYYNANEIPSALNSIQEALRLRPNDADSYCLLSEIYLSKGEWHNALKAAETGLRFNPDHINCLNCQAWASVQLDRKLTANAALDTALARNPENARTHATKGWTLLHQNDPKQALYHFRESLRLSPNFSWAQRGILEAIKAQNMIYRYLLAYFLWMGRLEQRTRVGIIIGGIIVLRILSDIASQSPNLSPFVNFIIFLYIGFVFLSWTGKAVFDLLLRLHPTGRLILPREDLIASNWVGVCILLTLVFFVLGLVTVGDTRIDFNIAAVQSLVMMIPVSAIFQARTEENQRLLTGYALGLAGLAIFRLITGLMGSEIEVLFLGLFVLGFLAYTWIANAILFREHND